MTKKISILIGLALLTSVSYRAMADSSASHYKKSLKQYTRHDNVYEWDNMEARVIWNATYLSDDFRAARRKRLAELYEWSAKEQKQQELRDREELKKYDAFILTIYSGSSKWSEIGKDSGKWKIVLKLNDNTPVENSKFERLPATEVERGLYPQLDKWSQIYLIQFPKSLPDSLRQGESFRLKMTGIPAKSELIWKGPL